MATSTAGYSSTPLSKRLGLKEGHNVWSGLRLVVHKELRGRPAAGRGKVGH